MERTRNGVESRSDTDRNPISSATGRHQFIGDTFRRYYRREFPNSVETDAQINEQMTDGAIQDRLMNAYVDDSERMLNRAEIPITPGRLYLLHLAGHPKGMRIVREPQRPIREILSAAEISGNRLDPDWTGQDLLDYADGRMNGEER